MDIYGITDIGCARQRNEDSIHWQALPGEQGFLALVADGMGGYDGGDLASRVAVSYFTRCLLSALETTTDFSNDNLRLILAEAGNLANTAVRQERLNHPQYPKLGTTLLAMLVLGDGFWLVHAGDSRCYCASGDGLQPLTRDHSLVQELLDKGSLTAREAERAPFRNMLTRAVGPHPQVQFSFAKHRIQPGESWLLCSDGLYNALPAPVIDYWMRSGKSAREIAAALVRESLRHNAQDNVSVIVLRQNHSNRSEQHGTFSATGG
ncbi:MAG: protein phosphatase 2C domain-containing protein [Pseudomonadota bacterium]|nr:serine/threonine protein phosphatase [Pseudomonadales bacterium]MDY6919388.1 protein phosphatase 2C domain-containing protein [Pseudomonadota bacterium]